MKTIKLKVPFLVATQDLKGYESVDLTVTTTIPEELRVYGDPEFKVTIPDHMFKELADTEPQFDTEPDINKRSSHISIKGLFGEREITHKFKKTQTSKLISSLQSYMMDLTEMINYRHSIEKATLKKKLFIKFQHTRNHHTNGLNNAYRGETIAQTFNYFIGYEMFTESLASSKFGSKGPKKRYITKIGYASPNSSVQHYNTHFKEREDLSLDLPGLHQSIEAFENEFSIIDWSEEREDFLKRIKETFVSVNEELSDFLKDMSDDKIEALMASGGLKFLK